MPRFPRSVVAAVTIAAASACSGPADAPTASAGFFPATYTGATVVDAPLSKSGEVGPHTSTLTFHLSVPKGQAFTLVTRCDRGRIGMTLPGGTEDAPCDGLSFLDNGCNGGHRTVTFRVSEPQTSNWGVALYTGRNAASPTCR